MVEGAIGEDLYNIFMRGAYASSTWTAAAGNPCY